MADVLWIGLGSLWTSAGILYGFGRIGAVTAVLAPVVFPALGIAWLLGAFAGALDDRDDP